MDAKGTAAPHGVNGKGKGNTICPQQPEKKNKYKNKVINALSEI